MTTLPQTTQVRLPATIGPGTGAPVTAGLPAHSTAFQLTGADAWRIIRGNIWLILILLVLSTAAGIAVHWTWLKRWPKFTSVGLLEVETSRLVDPVTDRTADMPDTRVMIEQRTHASGLRNAELVSELLKTELDAGGSGPQLRSTAYFKKFQGWDYPWRRNLTDVARAKEAYEDDFSAVPVPDTRIIQVSFTTGSAQDSSFWLKRVVDQYLERRQADASGQYRDQLDMLRTLVANCDASLRSMERELEVEQRKLAESGMPVSTGGFSFRADELRWILDARLKAESEAQTAVGMLKAMEAQASAKMFDQQVEMDGLLSSLNRELLGLEIQSAILENERGPVHPDVKRVKQQMEVLKEKIDRRHDDLSLRLREQMLGSYQSQASSATAMLDAVKKEEKAKRDELAALSRDLAQYQVRLSQAVALRDQKQQLESKLRDVQSLSARQARPQIGWIQAPNLPDVPSSPKLTFTMPIAILIGLALGLGIAFLRELLSDTVRSPRDIARVGQMNVLGIVADEADDPQASEANLAIFDAPYSHTAEQFRQVRTRLQHAASLDTTRSIMVTGPSPQDGKTTVAANLAAGLALNGRRILLVDANFRRPDLNRLFGLPNERGFSDVLNGTAPLNDLVHNTRVPNLAVLPSGAKPANVTELFESQLFVDFLEGALQTYDHVIFDSAPFLVVSESAAMAPRVDGVITVVRAHAETRGLLQRMRDSLKQIKAEHLGVVLNAVRAQGGGYYRRSIKTYYSYQNEA